MSKLTIDLEPKWTDIIRGVCNGAFDLKKIESDLLKLAKIGDTVRQAQKRGATLIFHPDGRVQEDEK